MVPRANALGYYPTHRWCEDRIAPETPMRFPTYDEAEALKTVLAQLDKLTTPAATMTVAELLDLNDRSVVVTATAGKLESKPATDQKAITDFQEHKSSLEKVATMAEAISDLASNSRIDDRKFH